MNRTFRWLKNRKFDVLAVVILLAVAGTVGALNMQGYPQRFEDEGTYVSQAFAVQKQHTLAHYTYWYDHPPVGWIQIAGYTTATHAFDRYPSAISAGREFMLVLHLVTVLLLYALARRVGIGGIAASCGVLLYVLSPLTIEFSRYVLLDNVALPWLLGAFYLALSKRHGLASAIGSAVCMAIAILSKETLVILLPVVLFALWHYGDRRNRRYIVTAFGVIFAMVSGAYVLYAALKNELLPGSGHVSLLGTLYWQIFGRVGSGSVLDPNSATRGLIDYWLHIDQWFIFTGIATLPISLAVRAWRPFGLALLIGVALLLRTGYLPYPYIIAVLPFAALTLAAAIQKLIVNPLTNRHVGLKFSTLRISSAVMAIVLLVTAVSVVGPVWQSKIHAQTSTDNDASSRQAVNYVNTFISRQNRLVVESALWTDIQQDGFQVPQPVWLYKTETDPAVTKAIGGWQGIDYVILNGPTVSQHSAKDFPTVYEAISHAKIVASFGQNNQKILIYKVDHSQQFASSAKDILFDANSR
ncbi:glycosyltransferase family 39 protein [Polaromonas sp.]|nr:glycosyltransferase family 39 protein [Candidatus Saccharibacteria bacterium]